MSHNFTQTFNTGHEPQHITGLAPPSNPNNQSGILFAHYVSTCLSGDTGHEPQHITGLVPPSNPNNRETSEILAFGHALMHTYACTAWTAPLSPPSLSAHWASLLSPSEPCALALGHFFSEPCTLGLREHLLKWAQSCNP
jgi:hypothetical protein